MDPRILLSVLALVTLTGSVPAADPLPVDLSHYQKNCGVQVEHAGQTLRITWPMPDRQTGMILFNLTSQQALIQTIGIGKENGPVSPLLQSIDPVTYVTVGTRQVPAGRPPQLSEWSVFFDKPASRPHRTYSSALELKRVQVSSNPGRATVILGELTIGPFSGEWRFTVYAGSRLIHAEAVVQTQEEHQAILYDAGLAGTTAGWKHIAWMDTTGKMTRETINTSETDRALPVRHRAVIAESDQGAVACFPPPHQYHFPRDWTDNLKFAWRGQGHHGTARFGFGIRQEPDGKRSFEPWCNAPPNTKQHLGVFYLLTSDKAEDALKEALRYTHDDKFLPLPGHLTFTSHYHMAVAVAAMQRKFQGIPEFVSVFKEMGVNAVHIADFHGDGHPKDPGPLRLPEMEAMFKECRRLSDDRFLLIPGEEINDFLGIREPGKHPGHWMSLFPRPVYWMQQRTADQPWEKKHPQYGTIYRVGNQREMMDLLTKEKGLAWTAHPRIKASSWTPDIFRREEFYLADYWLGAAWKAMPADLSMDRLGVRCLDLLDDMANWGQKKYLPGEVDVFKIDKTHELYGHMNINYLRLDRLPRYDEGWQPILDVLRSGRFFVTTGEVLLHECSLDGKEPGQTLKLLETGQPELRVALEWTFPLVFAEVISGDGQRVYRQRIDLTDTGPFGKRTLTLKPELKGRKWLRFEVWDVAVNGAYTQPIWLK